MINNYFWFFYWFCVLLSYNWLILFFSIMRIRYFFISFFASMNKSFSFFSIFNCSIDYELLSLENHVLFIIMSEDIIANMESNKELGIIITELFLRWKQLNVLLVFISQFYFKVPKTISLYAIHYFIMKIPNNKEL